MLAYLLLGLAQLAGLLMIPFGAPGGWVQLAALALFAWHSRFDVVGAPALVILLLALLTSEITTGLSGDGRIGRSNRRRVAFAGLAGGAAGVGLGLWIPIVGSLFGALFGSLAGSFAGAVARWRPAEGLGILVAQVVVATMKVSAAFAIAVVALHSLLR